METKRDNTAIQLIVALSIVIISAIAGVSAYNINDRTLMSKNIEQAIAKGVDPLSVKCSYQTYSDPICITYSMKK
jgi:hypothetical protein